MKNVTTHTGELRIIERLNNSRNGNPRFLLTVDGFTCLTKPDAALNYDIENLDGAIVHATIGTYYGKATLRDARPLTRTELLNNLDMLRKSERAELDRAEREAGKVDRDSVDH